MMQSYSESSDTDTSKDFEAIIGLSNSYLGVADAIQAMYEWLSGHLNSWPLLQYKIPIVVSPNKDIHF